MSYTVPRLTNGMSAGQSIYEARSTPVVNVGTRAILPDGRVFYYAANRSPAIAAGVLVGGNEISGDMDDLATNTAAVGDKVVSVTPVGTATYTANQLQGGFLLVNSSKSELSETSITASSDRFNSSCSRRENRACTGQVRAARILSAEPAGLFDAAALAIARGSRLSPAYRDAQPIPATALLTLRFDPQRAACPGLQRPDRNRSPAGRPPPKVTRRGERPIPSAES